MRTLTVHVTDDQFTLLEDRAARTNRSFEQVASQTLQWGISALRDVAPGTTPLLVHGDVLEALEKILGGGNILNQPDLLKKVQRLAGISFLHVRLPFTPGQLEQLAEKAKRNSLTVQQLVDRTAPRIYEHFFDLVERS